MAAAEARAVWQRTANRCFIQEDAKRAPKLASASASLKHVDAGHTSVPDGQEDNPSVGFVPINRNNSHTNLTPDSKWWLQMQPNYGYGRGLVNEQLNSLEAEMETFIATSKPSGAHLQNKIDGTRGDDEMNSNYSFDTRCRNLSTCIKEDHEIKKKGLSDMDVSYELLEMDFDGCVVSKKASELCSDSEFPWVGAEKVGPWWRTADTDELAYLVAQRSLDPIENCDLPRPRNTHLKRDPYTNRGCFGHDVILPSSLARKAQTYGPPNLSVRTQGKLTSGSACTKQLVSVEGHSQHGSNAKTRKIDSATPKYTSETKISESDPRKAQLLEALRHSQTRAREAEKAAKEAYAEKEHIIKLFFKQASHFFAYKQWFQLLQLENLYFQIKNNNHSLYGLFPVALPLTRPRKTRKLNGKRGKRAKQGSPGYDIGKFAFAFALGFSLISAGLLLGWTIGWMLPMF